MNRVEVTRSVIGLCHMQVCAEKDATDEDILSVCNLENPSGTSLGWCHVIRDDGEENQRPKTCSEWPERMHFLVNC